MIRIAINGYGRIGRMCLRAFEEAGLSDEFTLVAINDLAPAQMMAHLTRYDSSHGRFPVPTTLEDNQLKFGQQTIQVFHEQAPERLPWAELDIDIVFECSGLFTTRVQAEKHLQAGAKRVLISAPAQDADATLVFGVNENQLSASHRIVSNASCTTNCLAMLVKILHQALTIEQGLMTTIHAYTNDQNLIDGYHADYYRGRQATASIIPTRTGAASAIDKIFPELTGKIDGLAIRVPTSNVSLVDFTFNVQEAVTLSTINQLFIDGASALPGLLCVNHEALVSIDFNHTSFSAIVDLNQTRVQGRMIKVFAWYDNEWAFANRMWDTARWMSQYLRT